MTHFRNENEPGSDTASALRFDFGKNWASFAATLNERQLAEAERSLLSMLDRDRLKGAHFLDVGCGSGIHALAALRLGAANVWAIDLDPHSVSTTQAVLERWWSGTNYRVERKSVFDLEGVAPQADIVYSWGVLHHTGEMARAIRAASSAVKPGGTLAIALYGRTRYCGMWTRIKRWYVQATPQQRQHAEDWYVRLFGFYLLLRGQRLSSHIANHEKKRGMDFYHNVRDWIGGYPYESITPQQLEALTRPLGLVLEKQKVTRRSGLFGSGNDEYVFRRSG